MAYAQWGTFVVQALNFDVTIKNISLSWGKFYDSTQIGNEGGDKDKEYLSQKIEGKIIKSGSSFAINACGRSDAASGTEGSFQLYDGDTLVGTYSWDCPWGSKTNSSTWVAESTDYITQQSGANLNAGALGTVKIQVVSIKGV